MPIRFLAAAAVPALFAFGAAAQDVRGLENCAAEKQMERRTGCLQANTEFLQQALQKLARETQQKLAAAHAEVAALRAQAESLAKDNAALREAIANTQARLDAAEKAKKDGK